MIKVTTDTMKKTVNMQADFMRHAACCGDVQEFTSECGIELRAAVLGVISAAQDAYIAVIQSKSAKQINSDQRDNLAEVMIDFVKDIKNIDVTDFRHSIGY